jgi:hypothetical protein
MPKGAPPAWNRRDCSFDHLVRAALTKGNGIIMVYSGIETLDRAHEIRRGIYRCCRHRQISAEAGPAGRLVAGDDMGVRKTAAGYELRYRIWSKGSGRKHVLATYGPDRSGWAYDPRRTATDAERDSWANKDEQGGIVRHN